MEPDTAVEVQPVILGTFREYVARRTAFYATPGRVLASLLKKDLLLYAVRGVKSAEEFVEQAFAAFESSSEETMWGNAWQEAIAKAAPNTVGGGDLRTERDGTLWMIQLKLGAQNAGAQAQDLRVLQTKVRREVDHHPGRRSVKAMYAVIRDRPRNEWRHNLDKSPENEDIHGFQYQYMSGVEFLRWISADFSASALVEGLQKESGALPEQRRACIAEVKHLLSDRLTGAGLQLDMVGVMDLVSRPTTRRKTGKDQSSTEGTDTASRNQYD